MSAVAGPADVVSGVSLTARWSDYVQMSRPRILIMSAVAVLAGYVLAGPEIDWLTAGIAVSGILCLVAASSVLNQVWEAGRDARMRRTIGRPLASGRVSRVEGLSFGLILAVVGGFVLWNWVNVLTSVSAVLTMLCYVLMYTPLKPLTAFCTTVGAVPGRCQPCLGGLRPAVIQALRHWHCLPFSLCGSSRIFWRLAGSIAVITSRQA